MILAVALAVTIATLVMLGILAVALIRQLKALSRTMARFQDEARPILLELQRQSAIAQARQEDLRRSGGRLRAWRSGDHSEPTAAPRREA